MADFLTAEARSDVMGRVRSERTTPEVLLLRALRRLGVRPGVHAKDLPGKPDIVFRRDRLAVFVDGELWHGGQWRRRGLDCLDEQFANADRRTYWVQKVQRNVERDIRNTGRLLADGWMVLRLWDRDVERDPDGCAERVVRVRTGVDGPSPRSVVGAGTAADFFAGIGLMRDGIARAGWRTVWANDHDPVKNRLYAHNLGGERVTIDGRAIQDVAPGDVPSATVYAGGFPCTDVSLAGAQRGIHAGPQSSAFLRFAELVERKADRPPFVLLENVVGLITSNGGEDLRTVVSRLGDLGYLVDVMVVDARHFVPQSRPRMFIVGVRTDLDIDPRLDVDALEPSDLRPRRLVEFVRAHGDLAWGLRPMPDLPELEVGLTDVLDDLGEDDAAWWSDARVEKLRGQVSGRHLAEVERRVDGEGVVWATAFRRMRQGRSMAELRFDGLAGCLRTPKGGSAKQIVVRVDGDGWRVRLLTPRECARLMGVDGFRFDAEGVSSNDALFGFGDAVASPAVAWVVRNAINPIAAEWIRGEPMGLGA